MFCILVYIPSPPSSSLFISNNRHAPPLQSLDPSHGRVLPSPFLLSAGYIQKSQNPLGVKPWDYSFQRAVSFHLKCKYSDIATSNRKLNLYHIHLPIQSDATSFLKMKLNRFSKLTLCKPPVELGNRAPSGQGRRNYWPSYNLPGGLNSW